MPILTRDQTITLARDLHRANRLAEAESVYRQMLAQDPNFPEILHLLGLLCIQRGAAVEALEFLRRAVELAPSVALFQSSLGNALLAQQRYPEALAAYDRAIGVGPESSADRMNRDMVRTRPCKLIRPMRRSGITLGNRWRRWTKLTRPLKLTVMQFN